MSSWSSSRVETFFDWLIDTQGTEKKTFHLHVIFKLLDARLPGKSSTQKVRGHMEWVEQFSGVYIYIQLDAGNTHEVCQSRDEHPKIR